MAYRSGPPTRPGTDKLIIGVGWRAYINWSPASDAGTRPLPMTDGFGNQIGNDLVDGQEVEIVSWQPRSRAGLSYQVRRISDGSAWWIAAKFLRRRPVRDATAEDALSAAPEP